ncbi:MAG: ComEC/Rec2 family competence protein [Anaerolineae bacterium]|nr:ComEC/Rec2 family competence protein [Anaerolineae bacterium]
MRLVYLTLAWAGGILLAANNSGDAPYLPLVWLILLGAAILSLWLVRDQPSHRWLALLLILLVAGGLRLSLHLTRADVARYNQTGGLTLEGIITSEPNIREDRTQLRVEAQTITQSGQTVATSGQVLVEAPRFYAVQYGDRIAATGILNTPAEYDTFSYADFLARSGVFSIMRFAVIEVQATDQASPLYSTLLKIKNSAHEAINRYLPEPQAGLLSGILLGNESNISPETREDFNTVGAAHVIAISGFNMVILSGTIMRLLNRLRLRQPVAVTIGIVTILIYTLLVGANAAVVRAAIMSSVLLIGQALKRKTYVPASLAFTALILSFMNPTVLWDISFQLSFFATLGLALYVDPLARLFNRILNHIAPQKLVQSISAFLSEPLIVTLAAQITALPLIILYFGQFSPIFLPVNLLIIPIQAVLLILGLAATLVSFVIPILAQLLFWMDYLLLSWTIGVVRWFAQLPYALLEIRIDPRLIALYFVVLLGIAMIQATQPPRFLRFIRQRAVLTATFFAGILIASLSAIIFLSRPDNLLHLWLLDVGHNNAILVQTPGGAQFLVDGGRFPSRLLTSIGDRLPFYDRELEMVALTQPDTFDFSALPAVLERYDAGIILTNGQPNMSEAYTELQTSIARFPGVNVTAGYRVETSDHMIVEVLHPQQQPTLNDPFDNQTVVLRISYGEVSFLLTSDLSIEGQQAVLESGNWPLATVLQLPQHGRAQSLSGAFLEAVQPQVAIVQADPANQRGDPDPDTLALLGDTPIYRTDEIGTIHLYTDGTKLWVEN